MTTQELLYICPNCLVTISIIKDDNSTTTNLTLCPDCGHNLFPQCENPDALLKEFNTLSEIKS